MNDLGLNFNGVVPAVLGLIGLLAAGWIFDRTNNTELALAVFFFFSLEILQSIQYFYAAPDLRNPQYQIKGSCAPSPMPHPLCESFENQFLTLLGFLHVCMQPYFVHTINASLTKSCRTKDRYKIIRRLCAIGGFLLFARYFLHWVPRMDTMDLVRHPSTEWMRGNQLCTFKTRGMAHLGWSIPMADPSYYVMGASIHAFLMFAPFVALYEQKGLVLQGLVLLLTGPVLSSYLSSNNMEKGNIWGCLSIVQILVMLFLIREPLLKGPNDLSVMKAVLMDPETEGPCLDYINCEYCNRTDVHLEYKLMLQSERESDLSFTDNDESGNENYQGNFSEDGEDPEYEQEDEGEGEDAGDE